MGYDFADCCPAASLTGSDKLVDVPPEPKVLPPAAQRSLTEAEERRDLRKRAGEAGGDTVTTSVRCVFRSRALIEASLKNERAMAQAVALFIVLEIPPDPTTCRRYNAPGL